MGFRVVSLVVLVVVGVLVAAAMLSGFGPSPAGRARAPEGLSGVAPAASPTLGASPTSGPVGTAITFTGAGFAKKSAVTVSWVQGAACSSTTNSSGGFTCVFDLTQYPPGAETFTATDASDNSAGTTFTIVPQLTVSPTSGPAGTTVTFTGTGFDSREGWYVTWQSGLVNACEAVTNAYGSFTCSYTIPAGTATGKYVFTSEDPSANTAATTYDVTYTPTLTAIPNAGPIGTTITFKGAGFAGSSPITVSWPEGTACTATTNTSGGFSCTFELTQFTPGAVTFSATDSDSGTADAVFTVVPQLTVSPTSGPAGTTVTFTGTGFDGSEAWYVTWQSGLVNACEAVTNGYGSFTCSYTIPTGTAAGKYVFTSEDPSTNTAMATFTVHPTLAVSPASGLVGSVLTFTGTSFAASSSVTVAWSGGTACTATASPAGDFNCTFTVPSYTLGGSYKFTGTDSSKNSATASFDDTAVLKVSPTSGVVGGKETFTGSGFAANSSISVTWSAGIACTATTGVSGGFSCTFKVPATTAGSYTFNATDANDNSATAKYKVKPQLSATPGSGTVGSSVVFSGTGYAGRSAVNVTWTSGTACHATTSAVGSFDCEFSVTPVANGMYTFTATDSKANTGATTYTVSADLLDSPGSGPVGTPVNFTGTGFAGNSAVTLSWSGGTACLTSTDSAGNFSCIFTIPAGTSTGSYTFTATDAQSNSAKVSFDVT